MQAASVAELIAEQSERTRSLLVDMIHQYHLENRTATESTDQQIQGSTDESACLNDGLRQKLQSPLTPAEIIAHARSFVLSSYRQKRCRNCSTRIDGSRWSRPPCSRRSSNWLQVQRIAPIRARGAISNGTYVWIAVKTGLDDAPGNSFA